MEVQSTDRDLITLPNLYLVTHPVKVIRSSGTLISEEVSIGYDVNRKIVKTALAQAGHRAGLKECFVNMEKLGDFSVVYRVYGFLEDIKSLLTVKAKLRSSMLDSLHESGVEIVSPTFMNQRPLKDGQVFIPRNIQLDELDEITAEELVFDKADEAESIENLKAKVEEAEKRIQAFEDSLKEAGDKEKAEIKKEIESLKKRQEYILRLIKKKQERD